MDGKIKMFRFNCDYLEGAHPKILERLIATNEEQTPGYGEDLYTASAKEKIKEACACPDAKVYFLVGGTQTNVTVLDSLLKNYEGVLSADTGHINVHEAGAVELTGHKVITVPAENGKLSPEKARAYMKNFENISENVMVVIAFSCSKTLTSYGMRCGAAVIAAKDAESVREAEIVFEKSARALWSNVNNGAMHNFVNLVKNHKDEFMAEKAEYIRLLRQRSDIFVKEAAECNLPLYPYKEGFFITLKVDNAIREKYHEVLMENNIFTVQVNKGIRVAVCSLPVEKAKGLAKRMKDILDSLT